MKQHKALRLGLALLIFSNSIPIFSQEEKAEGATKRFLLAGVAVVAMFYLIGVHGCASQNFDNWQAHVNTPSGKTVYYNYHSYGQASLGTITALKDELFSQTHITQRHQALQAFIPNPWTWGYTGTLSPELQDNQMLKVLVNHYKTNTFKLSVKL